MSRLAVVRIGPVIAGLLVGVAGLGACADGGGSRRADGCTPVAREEELLDLYARDPVFEVRPLGVQEVFPQSRSMACRVDPEHLNDPSDTAVNLSMSVPPGLSTSSLSTVYEPVVTAGGWRQVVVVRSPDPANQSVTLLYCKQVRGVTSYLRIGIPRGSPQGGVRGPGGATAPAPSPRRLNLPESLSVRISAAPEEPSCRQTSP